jgi:hypothetical protein
MPISNPIATRTRATLRKACASVCAAFLLLIVASFAQARGATLQKVYIGSDGLAHVIDAAGKDVALPKEKDQVDVSEPKLSPDKQTAGWLVHQDNCCTSYTIPTRLAIYRAGKKRILGDGLMIYDWCFVAGGSQIAMSTGTVHGMEHRHLLLYNTRSGRQLQEWTGKFEETPPSWAKDLKQ